MAQDVDVIDMNIGRVSLRCTRHSIVGQRKNMLPDLRYFKVFIETAFTLRRCVRLSFCSFTVLVGCTLDRTKILFSRNGAMTQR